MPIFCDPTLDPLYFFQYAPDNLANAYGWLWYDVQCVCQVSLESVSLEFEGSPLKTISGQVERSMRVGMRVSNDVEKNSVTFGQFEFIYKMRILIRNKMFSVRVGFYYNIIISLHK